MAKSMREFSIQVWKRLATRLGFRHHLRTIMFIMFVTPSHISFHLRETPYSSYRAIVNLTVSSGLHPSNRGVYGSGSVIFHDRCGIEIRLMNFCRNQQGVRKLQRPAQDMFVTYENKENYRARRYPVIINLKSKNCRATNSTRIPDEDPV